MAATPKRSLRRTVASTVEERSPRFLLGSLALAMVIALLAGLGIGIKIGEHDKSNKAKPAATVKPKKTPSPRRAFALKGPLIGTIRFKGPHALVIKKKTGPVTLGLVPKTVIEVTTAATSADIKAGSHVLFVLKPGSKIPPPDTTPTGLTSSSASGTTTATSRPSSLTAKEIIVVSGSDKVRLGAVVRSVTADSMTFVLPNGKPLTISTTGARIVKTIPGKKVNLTVGKRVVVRSFQQPAAKKTTKTPTTKKKAGGLAAVRKRIALEIVILPVNSAFT